eukprot:SM001260S26277  [mRNA]  locus=s1260:1103:2028:- [translate_table: standard]
MASHFCASFGLLRPTDTVLSHAALLPSPCCCAAVLAAKRAGANGGAAAGGGSDTFLGLLYPTEDYRVYGYVSNTRIKFVLVADDEELRDADVRDFFRRFHSAYVDAASNPFHVPGKRITSPAFAERVGTIVRSFRATAMT